MNIFFEYICRKRLAILNVQATCDVSERFTSANSGTDALLLGHGDEGYGIAPWLMTSYKEPGGRHSTFFWWVCATRVSKSRF